MFKSSVTIEWGDCDEAGIVFYPNYFYWIDSAFQKLLRAGGMSLRDVRKRFGAVTPIVQAHADFRSPARYDDVLDITATVTREGDRKFRVDYAFSLVGKPIGSAHEVRAWALVQEDGSLRGATIEAEFLKAIGATE
jgi:4-hydroxybenzoyl-CoA thioesterase